MTEQEASISKAGELETLSEAVSSFVHVDLKGNLLSDWQEVNGICVSYVRGVGVYVVGRGEVGGVVVVFF